ncbi:hypothetical protein JQS43_13030 [Natronosporangium hydrolyticum]|uniref:Uncharacterized protein n=1 Tax=Natronosporangium hydrolyticum TaxID=2811111 RepID=A0A895Y8P2_9ACTN|nr:hypothetical protein [Natronosporangium hydrolyticum]QSB12632.1 hypothetical protein JQS43_13030 [Natronosporangium hydrolyticum]
MSSHDQPRQPARGFPAFPPVRGRGGPEQARWWVKGWSAAVAELLLDQSLLTRGRRLARTGTLGPITITALPALPLT